MPVKIVMNDKFKDDEEYKRYFPVAVEFDADMVWVTLADGRIIGNPLSWHPWLLNATPEQRSNVVFYIYAVEWPDLDEGLDIEGMLRGIPSAAKSRTTETV